jgi:uncharacterized membrane protein HdeD (DUF308 family)
MTELTPSSRVTDHPVRWKWFLALGVVLLLLGLAGAGASTLLELASLLVFAPMLLASSSIQLVTAFLAEKGKDRFLHYAAAALEMVLGFFIMARPLQGVGSLVAWTAIVLMASGLVRLARSLATRSRGRGWTVMAGIVALLLGIAVWTEWPVAGLWFVGLCLALDFLCHGASWSALALAERKPLQESLA